MTSIFSMEPLFPDDEKRVLAEIALDLVDRASGLAGRVHCFAN